MDGFTAYPGQPYSKLVIGYRSINGKVRQQASSYRGTICGDLIVRMQKYQGKWRIRSTLRMLRGRACCKMALH